MSVLAIQEMKMKDMVCLHIHVFKEECSRILTIILVGLKVRQVDAFMEGKTMLTCGFKEVSQRTITKEFMSK